MSTFFPPAPHGYYFKIRPSRNESLYALPPWAVVLVKRVWGIFPWEVGIGLLDSITPEQVTQAAEAALADWESRKNLEREDRARRAINRAERRSTK